MLRVMLPPMCRAEGVIWWFQIYWTPSNAIATIQIDKIELISALLVYFLTYFFEDNLPTPSALAYPPPSLPRCCVFFNDSNYPGCFIPLGIHKHVIGERTPGSYLQKPCHAPVGVVVAWMHGDPAALPSSVFVLEGREGSIHQGTMVALESVHSCENPLG